MTTTATQTSPTPPPPALVKRPDVVEVCVGEHGVVSYDERLPLQAGHAAVGKGEGGGQRVQFVR